MSYPRGALIAGIISLIGILAAIVNMNIGHPIGFITFFAIPFTIIGTIFGFMSAFGCGFESNICPMEQSLGFIITFIFIVIIGYLIGKLIEKLNNK
ncbi:MAG: hypothetical protein WC323_02905 [Patescibacteria group bacterium]|jgi:FtsH-binding integral membrane protein